MGQFVARKGLAHNGPAKPGGREEQKPLHSTNPNKPMSIQERIKLLKKNQEEEEEEEEEEGGARQLTPPPKPVGDVSPLSGRKMKKQSSVKDLMKKYGNSSDERECVSPEDKPSRPPKPSLSPKHGGGVVSPAHGPKVFQRRQVELPEEDIAPERPAETAKPPPSRRSGWVGAWVGVVGGEVARQYYL